MFSSISYTEFKHVSNSNATSFKTQIRHTMMSTTEKFN